MVALQISRTLPAQITPLMMSEANISHQHRVSFYNPRFTYLAQPKHRRRLRWSKCLAHSPNCMQNVTYLVSAHRYAVEGQTSRRRGGCSSRTPKGRTFVRLNPTQCEALEVLLTFRRESTTPPLSRGSIEHVPAVSFRLRRQELQF